MKHVFTTICSGLSNKGLIATVASVALGAGVLGGVGAVYGPSLLKKDGGERLVPDTPEVVENDKPKVGFEMGSLAATDPVQSIKVTVQTGAEGADLAEKLDLHLGLGFPLRLFPLGEDKMSPSFAAFPQGSSLERGENSITAGQSATFEFDAGAEEPGQDRLLSTPQLLKDVTVGDLQKIGFASLGENEWILEGYRIEVNGQLFAANDSVNAQPGTILGEKRAEMASLLPGKEALLDEIATLETYVATGLASDADKAELEAKKTEIQSGATAMNELAGISSGYYPWYDEADEAFAPPGGPVSSVKELGITLIAGGGQQPGTRNPLYIKAGGKKFQLTSEVDPLADVDIAQEFFISMADFEASPVSRDDLNNIGVGLIGNEERFGAIPDRAKVQRLVITADGEQVYDSERKTEDRKALEAFWLIPPAHLDDEGELVRNEETPVQKHLWISGMIAPEEPDEVIPGENGGGLPPLPIPPDPTDPEDPTDPKDPTDPTDPKDPTDPTDPKIPDVPTPPVPAPNPLSQQKTLLTGSPSGTFIPVGTVDPATGLQRGVLSPGQAGGGGFTPIRRGGAGGLNPGVFSNPSGGGGGGRLSPANTAAIINALANLIRPVPPRPNPSNTPTQPRVTNVKFASGVSEVVLGSPVKVEWQVQSGTAGASTISNFQVELWGYLPHRTVGKIGPTAIVKTLEPGSKRTATLTISEPGASPTSLGSLTVSATAGATGLSREEIAQLWIRPVVTPLSNGQTIGSVTAGEGPILPLIANSAAGSIVKTNGGDFKLQPGPQTAVAVVGFGAVDLVSFPLDINGNPGIAPFGKFQLDPGDGSNRHAWQDVIIGKPDSSKRTSVGLLAVANTDTLAALPVGPGTANRNANYFNVAARTGNVTPPTNSGDTAEFMYEGFIQYPTDVSKLRGYRLVGHLGWLSGPAGREGKNANVQIRVDLSGNGTQNNPFIRRDRQKTHITIDPLSPAGNVPHSAWMRMETDGTATVSKTSGGAMKLIDVPIRFDHLDKANPAAVLSAYPPPKPVDGFAAFTIKGSALGDPANHLQNPIQAVDLIAYNFAKGNGARRINVTVTIMIDTSDLPQTDSLGVFGLRLVPDIYY